MDESTFHALLQSATQYGASDILLKADQAPAFRVGKTLRYLKGAALTAAQTEAAAMCVLRRSHTSVDLASLKQFDTAYQHDGSGRYRVNIYRQRGSLALALRRVPQTVPDLKSLGAPEALNALADLERGMVLVVGAAGNGKSTTLASMVDRMNRTRSVHIVTIEDPIEFIHRDIHATVSQREIGPDTENFASALRAALRQNPDTILVGEIRDSETMDIALQASETGHLVLSTLHTPDASRTVGRILSLTAGGDPRQTRHRLADNLQGIIAQRLVPHASGTGLVLVCELLVMTSTAKDSIRRGEGGLPLKDVMERGQHPYGMQTFRMHLDRLVAQGVVSAETAQQTLA